MIFMNRMHRFPGMLAGIAVGIAAAGAASALSNGQTRRKLRHQADHARHSVGEFAKNVSDAMK
jgi:hypothetical protein